MKLVLTGKHDIQRLEEWAHSMFSPVENKNVEIPALGVPLPYDKSNLGQIFKYVPVKD